MKRSVSLLITILLSSLSVMSEGIDRTTALKRAQAFMPGKQFVTGKNMPSARAHGKRKTDAFYIFNAEDNGGFVIVSGDDRTKEILAYSEHGSLDVDVIPENLRWWLNEYVQQIEALGDGAEPVKQPTLAYPAAIAPMITTHWSQHEPYNYMCPDGKLINYDESDYDTDNRCVTGCVATAMAQLMYYWKWPDTCPALDGYGRIKALPATAFQWNLMKDSYTDNETGTSANAVAQLMRYCGQSMGMAYGTDGSSAYLDPARMAAVFQYSANCRELKRDYYTISHWESIIYNELKASRPVPYSGRSKEGHQFIVDGYDGKGLFHFNWGWGGSYDLYGVLSLADTKSSKGAYQSEQRAIVGLKPAEPSEQLLPVMSYYNETSSITSYNRSSSGADFTNVSLSGRIKSKYMQNPSIDITAEIGWGIYQDETFYQAFGTQTIAIPASAWEGKTYANNVQVSFGAGLPLGEYQIYQIYRFGSSDEWKRCEAYRVPLVAEVATTTLTLSRPNASDMSFLVNSIALSEEPETGYPVDVTLNVTNTGGAQHIVIALWSQKQGNAKWSQVAKKDSYIDRGKSDDVTLSYIPSEEGLYNLKVTTDQNTDAIITSTLKVADNETIAIDGITYLCTPDYHRAKVIKDEDADRSLNTANILSTVSANGVSCQVKSIEEEAFSFWYNLTSVFIPESIEYIGEGAFRSTRNLVSVISRIKNPFAISDNVFANSTWNDETQLYDYSPIQATLYVPVGTKSKYMVQQGWTWFAAIEEGELQEALVDGLKYAYNPEGSTATVIKDDSYKKLSSVNIPASVNINGKSFRVTAIGKYAFMSCYDITSVSLPKGLERIGDNAFFNVNLSSLVIPEGVVSIGELAFAYAYNMTSLELPSSLKSIGEGAFRATGNLVSVISRIKNPFAISDNVFANSTWNDETQLYDYSPIQATLYVPVGTKSKYMAQQGWTWFAAIEEGELQEALVDGLKYAYNPEGSTATVIKDDSYKKLSSVNIPASVNINGKSFRVTAIGKSAFMSCYNITSVSLPKGLERIGNYAFFDVRLSSLVIPEGVVSIGEEAFAHTYNLTLLELPSTLKYIGEGAFRSTKNLVSVISRIKNPFAISDNVFANSTWNDETQLYDYSPIQATLYVPVGTKSKYMAQQGWTWFAAIEEGELQEALVDGLKYAYNPEGSTATVIKDDSYKKLSSVNIPASVNINGKSFRVTAIGKSAFMSCYNITSVSLPKGLERIGDNAFFNVNLSSLVIPEGVVSIGELAFAYAYNMTSLELPSSLKSIGEGAFRPNRNLVSVISHIIFPFDVCDDVFAKESWSDATQQNYYSTNEATLYVPIGTKNQYTLRQGWTWFTVIEESERAGNVSAINISTTNCKNASFYNLQGQRITNPQRGQLVIVRYADGTSRKVVVK